MVGVYIFVYFWKNVSVLNIYTFLDNEYHVKGIFDDFSADDSKMQTIHNKTLYTDISFFLII